MARVLERTVRLERMSSPEVREAQKESNGVAVIPVGAVEVHGAHLPLGTDSLETFEIGTRAAEAAGVVIAPPIWYGNSRAYLDFPGTVAVRPEVLKEFVKDVALSLVKHGFNKLVILDGHGGNYGILDILVEDLHLETGVLACHVRAWDMATVPKPEGVRPYDGHGGSSETSVMMYLCPQDVHEDEFADSSPEIDLTRYGAVFPGPSSLYSKGPVNIALRMGEMVERGHHGDPTWGDRDRGEALITAKANALAEFLGALKDNRIRYRSGGAG
jgi:creatinine amidohydrolase